MLTSLAKHTIRAHATDRDKTPAQVLELTNELVYRSTPSESFVTIFFGILDRRDGHLSYSNAGHTTAAVLRDGTVSTLGSTGTIVGAFPYAGFSQAEIWLDPNDVLFLYTDGLTEARCGRELYGETRLFEVLGFQTTAAPTEVVERIVDDVMLFCECELRDDLAILALRLVDADARGAGQPQLDFSSLEQ